MPTPRLTLAQFLNRVPWKNMKVDAARCVRTRQGYNGVTRCPIAAVTGRNVDHTKPLTLGARRLGLWRLDARHILADNHPDPEAVALRRKILQLIKAARS